MRRAAAPILIAIVTLAGCVPSPRAVLPPPISAPTSAPAPPQVAPALAPDWNDWPRTPGDWRYSRDDSGSHARFATAGVTMSCDTDRRIRLRLDGRRSLAPLTIRTSSVTRALTPTVIGDPPAGIVATLAATDPLLDAIAFSRGRFTIEQAGSAALVLPPYAEIGRVIEDCRG